jgi:WD40 repeat protein
VLWDWKRGEELAHHHLAITSDVPVLANFSPDGRRVAVREILHDLSWNESESHRHLEGSFGCFRQDKGKASPLGPSAFFPDGRILAAAGVRPGKVYLWDLAASGVLATLDTQAAFCLCVAVSPDGRMLAAAADKNAQLWDVQKRALATSLQGHSDFVRCLAFSNDSKTLASASSDGTLILWDVEAGRARATLRGHKGGVSWLAISPDDKTVASAGRDGTIKLWDLRSGEEKTTLKGHAGWVTSVAFSPDGRTLASTSEDGTLRLWRGAADEEVQSGLATEASAPSAGSPRQSGPDVASPKP